VQIFKPADALARSASAIFTGAVSSAPVLQGPVGWDQAKVSLVRFASGSRTTWHVHDGDQLLIVVDGTGHIGGDGGRLDVQLGDTVLIPAGERHYHGATLKSSMSHFSILGGTSTQVLDIVDPWPPVGPEGVA